MHFAIQEARRTLPQFFEQYANPTPLQEFFLVKVQFEIAGQSEHVWIANIDASEFPPTGTVANETSLPGLKFMETVSFSPERITDWMIIEDGHMVGGFTNQVAIERMYPEARAKHLASIPYKIRGHSNAA